LDEFQHPVQVQGGNKLFQKFTNLPFSSWGLAVAQRNLMDHLSLLSSQPPHATIDKTSICEAALGEIFFSSFSRKASERFLCQIYLSAVCVCWGKGVLTSPHLYHGLDILLLRDANVFARSLGKAKNE